MTTLLFPSVPVSSRRLSAEWAHQDVDLYLDRCQIDTPARLVEQTWKRVHALRRQVGTALDFGAGDGRFAHGGTYSSYVGYEIDRTRLPASPLPPNARIEHRCAFSSGIADADLCIGNPPFVRNQDLPIGWRERVTHRLARRVEISLSGLANAWQHFFLLSLLSVHDRGLCALVIPYEWVSRPSVTALRDFIRANGWHVDVYRLSGHSFETVLTTASITIVDKANRDGRWCLHDTDGNGDDTPMRSTSGADGGHIGYSRRARGDYLPRAVRGLSPGTQKVFVLTEAERARLGLKPGRDVQRCVTTLRHLGSDVTVLDQARFDQVYRETGHRCWLIDPDAAASGALRAYLDSVDPAAYATATCLERETWWRFVMPETPAALIATCFKGRAPKAVLNSAGAIAVGGVAGIHGASADWAAGFVRHLGSLDLANRIVPQAKSLLKIEPGQLNTLIDEFAAMAPDG